MFKRLQLSLKQVKLYIKSYVFLISVVSLGFGVINTLTSYSYSMREAVYNSSRDHYGGDLFIIGSDKQANGMLVIDKREVIEDFVDKLDIDYKNIYRRTNLLNSGIIYFNGTGIRQKNIFGVDFDNEEDVFLNMDYLKGSFPIDSKGILISSVTAGKLGAEIGDSITVGVSTRTGQANTGEFIVSGIVNDKSILGSYRTFMERGALNSLLNIPEDSYSSFGLLLDKNGPDYSIDLYNILKSSVNISDPINKKQDLTLEMDKHWVGVRHFVIPLSVYISQVSDLLLAMDIVTYLLYFIIGSIIVISVFVTLNLILRSRSSEIASIRAIGSTKANLFYLILGESCIVTTISIIIGFIVSLITFIIISRLNFKFIPGFDFFLIKGKLLPKISYFKIIINIAIIILSVLPSTIISVIKVLNKPIIDGLNGRLK